MRSVGVVALSLGSPMTILVMTTTLGAQPGSRAGCPGTASPCIPGHRVGTPSASSQICWAKGHDPPGFDGVLRGDRQSSGSELWAGWARPDLASAHGAQVKGGAPQPSPRELSMTAALFGIGSGTAYRATRAGESWLGEGCRIVSDGETLVSRDGVRTFRPPSWKPDHGKYQANFSYWIGERVGKPLANGHLDVTDMTP